VPSRQSALSCKGQLVFFTKLKQKITFINEAFYLSSCTYTLEELTFLSPDRLMGGGDKTNKK
jgi:hypothetical protein